LPGEQFATALADVLSGREEPGGRPSDHISDRPVGNADP
jgi:hypothetical protein